jgi:hypothetical protein
MLGLFDFICEKFVEMPPRVGAGRLEAAAAELAPGVAAGGS